ncbi:hypothetical protein FCU94_19000 [Vibrio sp. JPW-9-11-11]|nr:hypothetical protein [Vibrio sp. JPW-9-11-11]
MTLLTLGSHVSQAQDLTFDWDYTVSGRSTAHRDSLLVGEAIRDRSHSVDALLDVQFDAAGFSGLLAAKGSNIYHSDHSISFEGELIVQELMWQGSVGSLPLDLTLGKVRLDWGVGYGYRPLDLFKPYRRNPVGIQVEEGSGTAMLSYFDLAGEWSLVYTDSSWTQQTTSALEQATQQQGAGVRRYWLDGDSEWQTVLYYDDVRHGLAATSLVSVLNPAWSVHASAIYQRHYQAYQQTHNKPVQLTRYEDGYQGLIGLNWANALGNNIIVEYWYDSRAWSKRQWQSAFRDVDRLSANPVSQPMARSYANGLTHANLVEHNVMLHWSLDSTSWSQWQWSKDWLWLDDLTPTFDLLVAPQDGGVIATQRLNYTLYDSGSVSFLTEIAARFMTGDNTSIYANLPDKRMIFINLKGKF